MGGPVFLLKEGGEHVGRSPPEEPVGGSIQLRELPGRPGCELSGVHARVRELPDAVSTALSTERWAHMMAQLGRLCLGGFGALDVECHTEHFDGAGTFDRDLIW